VRALPGGLVVEYAIGIPRWSALAPSRDRPASAKSRSVGTHGARVRRHRADLRLPRAAALFPAAGGLVGLSRIACGAHFPSTWRPAPRSAPAVAFAVLRAFEPSTGSRASDALASPPPPGAACA
jgi:hypothetical protein